MAETNDGTAKTPPPVKVFVFMNEYGFRVEPGFAAVDKGDALEFHTLAGFEVTLKSEEPRLFPDGCIVIKPGQPVRVQVPALEPGFYPYDATVEIAAGRRLHALGGSGPGVIIKP